MLLSEKVAIVTGVGPGLGQELAYAFVREGARMGSAAGEPKSWIGSPKSAGPAAQT